MLQIILPARRVTGYVKDRETGEPRNYRLNGLLVFVIAHIVWAFEIGGLPRDWFYRSSLWAVVGGTVFCAIFAVWSVFTQPKGEIQNPWLALWEGRSQELQLFGGRIDIKMWWYVVGGTMLSLNALSGAAWHHNNVDDPNPGIYLYAAFWTFYTFDYFIWERVQLYTYDLIHEHIGFKLWWGGLVAYGWLFILPLWGMAPHSDPGYSTGLTYFWLIGVCVLFLGGWTIGRGANLQKYTFKRWPDRKFLWVEPKLHRGRRAQDPVQRVVGRRPPLQLPGRGDPGHLVRPGVRPPRQPVGLDLLDLRDLVLHRPAALRREGVRPEVRAREVGRVPGAGQVPDLPRHLLSRRQILRWR